MLPPTFKRKMNHAIQDYLRTCATSKFKPLMTTMNRVVSQYSKEEKEYRTGEYVYGYKDDESIMNNMMHVSDRWRCAARLRWIRDGLRDGHFEKVITPYFTQT